MDAKHGDTVYVGKKPHKAEPAHEGGRGRRTAALGRATSVFTRARASRTRDAGAARNFLSRAMIERTMPIEAI